MIQPVYIDTGCIETQRDKFLPYLFFFIYGVSNKKGIDPIVYPTD